MNLARKKKSGEDDGRPRRREDESRLPGEAVATAKAPAKTKPPAKSEAFPPRTWPKPCVSRMRSSSSAPPSSRSSAASTRHRKRARLPGNHRPRGRQAPRGLQDRGPEHPRGGIGRERYLRALYAYEHGKRLPHLTPHGPSPGEPIRPRRSSCTAVVPASHSPRSKRRGYHGSRRPGPTGACTLFGVPIFGSDGVLGTIVLEDHEREYAFGEADVRLLTTVAATMGVALENARLFDETQRLLKETEQRAAELAVINSIQEGMAAALDFQAIVDLVGDKLRECSRPATSASGWYDRRPNLRPLPVRVRARRAPRSLPPRRPEPRPRACPRMRARQTIVANNRRGAGGAGASQTIPGTDSSHSGRRRSHRRQRPRARRRSSWRTTSARTPSARPRCACSDRRREHGRRARERAPLRRDPAPVQGDRAARRRARGHQQRPEALAAELDIQAIYELVGDKIREIFDAQVTWASASTTKRRTSMRIRLLSSSTASACDLEPTPSATGASRHHVCTTRQDASSSTRTCAERARDGRRVHCRGHRRPAKSAIFVPLIGGRRGARASSRCRTSTARTRSATPTCACSRRSPAA